MPDLHEDIEWRKEAVNLATTLVDGAQSNRTLGGAGDETPYVKDGNDCFCGDDFMQGGPRGSDIYGNVARNGDRDRARDLRFGECGADTFEYELGERKSWKIWDYFVEQFNNDPPKDFKKLEFDRVVDWY